MIPVPRRVLVEMFARASSANRLASFLGEQRSPTLEPTLERLAGHIRELFEDLSGILGAAQLTVEPLPTAEGNASAPAADPIAAAEELRLFIGRADALAVVTHEHFPQVVVRDARRDVRRLAHLVELTAAAVADASDATDKLIAALERSLTPEEA